VFVGLVLLLPLLLPRLNLRGPLGAETLDK
jgi:hypothetical protein